MSIVPAARSIMCCIAIGTIRHLCRSWTLSWNWTGNSSGMSCMCVRRSSARMTFGPISIAPAYKRQGYGKRLLDYSMEKAQAMGAGALAITGNIDFYGKSGFVPAKTKGVRYTDDPDADYFLIKELTPGFLDGISGTYKDPDGYFVCDKDPEDFAQFEATFPTKQKLKLPGQLF